VRNAKDGTRVRLYQETYSPPLGKPVPQPNCKNCPQIALPAPAVPARTLTAEVSDDQVAGVAGGPLRQTTEPAGFDPAAAQVRGVGQPQPILVVIVHGGSGIATMEVTTPYGSDAAVPSG